MSPILETRESVQGRVVWVDAVRTILVQGCAIWIREGDLDSWRKLAPLEEPMLAVPGALGRIMRRLLRRDLHHLGCLPNGDIAWIESREIFLLENGAVRSRKVFNIPGSRPLSLCVTSSGYLYFGEYWSNNKRAPIRIFGSYDLGRSWQVVHTFNAVRHVHGVFFDSYARALWITTGDDDSESWIWRADEKCSKVEKVVGGSQQYRVVQPIFTEKHIYFGSDAPDEQNYIYRLSRETGITEQLVAVDGPVFWGHSVGDCLVFGTVCEPSSVNRMDASVLWVSNGGGEWQSVLTLEKDCWPMRLFQYGQIRFPAGPGNGKDLWYTPLALKGDQVSFRVSFT